MIANKATLSVRQACMRCRIHKRKCDKLLPRCSLCKQGSLGQICRYKDAASRVLPATVIENALTPHGIKYAIIQKLADIGPNVIISRHALAIPAWFKFTSVAKLFEPLPQSWNDASVDLTLLALVLVLFDTSPQLSGQCFSFHPDVMTIYLSSKSWLALLESTGLNSVIMINTRLLITLFEIMHGMYPAAYFSIAATIRAVDVLNTYNSHDSSLIQQLDSDSQREGEDVTELWYGIVILDRYIAIENGKWPPITRGRTIANCRNRSSNQNLELLSSSPFHIAFEASSHLDKVHTAIHEPTPERNFNVEEAGLIVTTLNSFNAVLEQQNAGSLKLSSTGLVLVKTGLLLIFENGIKPSNIDSMAAHCHIQSAICLATLIDDVLQLFNGLGENHVSIDVQTISPFVLYLIYKAADILTVKIQSELEPKTSLRKVKTLREILKLMSRRWLAGERYLRLLDENTTPKMLKAMNGV